MYVNVENLFSTKALKDKAIYIFVKNLNICDTFKIFEEKIIPILKENDIHFDI